MKNTRADLDKIRISSDGELLSGVFCVECGTLNPNGTKFCPTCGDLLADQGPDLRARLNRIRRYASGAPPVTHTPPTLHRLPIGPALALVLVGFLLIFSFVGMLPLVRRFSFVQGNIPIVPVATVVPSPTTVASVVDPVCLSRLAGMDKIAFEVGPTNAYAIYVASTDGTVICRLTNNANATFSVPSWSPDAQSIVFSAEAVGGGTDLYIVNTKNGLQDRLTVLKKGFTLGPVWSPDGKSIAFVSNFANQLDYDIYVIGAGGEPLRRLGLDGQKSVIAADSLEWSWDSKSVIYKVQGKEKNHYYSITTLTDQPAIPEVLPGISSDNHATVRSPDGAHRAIVTESGLLLVSDADGSNIRQLAINVGLSRPTWAPDSRSVAFVVRDGNSTRLATINIDGSNYRLPLRQPLEVYNVAWAPKPQP
jgi:dipeptidyl aminopeptidase/acylaminoacyl peptidase